MKAIEIKKQFINENKFKDVGVIAISQDNTKRFWYHVHEDEELPVNGFDIAIHIK